MSLKGFHLVFITCSTLLALVGAAWCLNLNSLSGGAGYLVGAAICFLAAHPLRLKPWPTMIIMITTTCRST